MIHCCLVDSCLNHAPKCASIRCSFGMFEYESKAFGFDIARASDQRAFLHKVPTRPRINNPIMSSMKIISRHTESYPSCQSQGSTVAHPWSNGPYTMYECPTTWYSGPSHGHLHPCAMPTSDPSNVWRSPIGFSFESPHEVGHGILQCDLRGLAVPLCCERLVGLVKTNMSPRVFLMNLCGGQQVANAHQILGNLGYSGLILGLIFCQLKLDNPKMAPNLSLSLSSAIRFCPTYGGALAYPK